MANEKEKLWMANAQEYIARFQTVLKDGQLLDDEWTRLYGSIIIEEHIADTVIPPTEQTKLEHTGTVITNLRTLLEAFTADIDTNFERFKP